MLNRILEIVHETEELLTLRYVAHRLDAQVSAVEPMVNLLMRTGLLECPDVSPDCVASCGGRCDPAACPFTLGLPSSTGTAPTPRLP
jgi:hypothetical protein